MTSTSEGESPLEPMPFPDGRIKGDKNQMIGTVSSGTIFGSIGGNVTIETTKRVTSLFQLPRATNDFTGRIAQLALLKQHMLLEKSKPGTLAIVAVTGMAGVGKSALVIYAAHQVKAQFPDAQMYVNLRGKDAQPKEPSEVLCEWLRALGLDESEIPASLSEQQRIFRSQLAHKRALVVLDNAQNESQVRPLLPSGENCAVLVTSRRPLMALAGVQEIRLKALPKPDAITLLAEIAGKARVAEEPDAAAEIVQLCGYLPLAIRIAGGVLRGKEHWRLSVDCMPLLKDEQKRLDNLVQDDGENIRASFNLSYRQLAESERRLFAWLGSLPTDFDIDAAVNISGYVLEKAQSSLESLIDTQLLEVVRPGQYRYHDLVLVYAREILIKQHQQALDKYRSLSNCKPEANVLMNLEIVHEKEANVLMNLGNIFWFQKKWQDSINHYQQGLEIFRSLNNHYGEIAILHNLSNVYKSQSLWQEATKLCCQRLEISRKLNNSYEEYGAFISLGDIYKAQRKWQKAIAQYEKSFEISHTIDDSHNGKAYALGRLAGVYQLQGSRKKAVEYYRQCFEIGVSASEHQKTTGALLGLGLVYREQGRFEESLEQYQKGLNAFRSLGDRNGEGQALRGLGEVCRLLKYWQKAVDNYQWSLDITKVIGDQKGEAESYLGLGIVYIGLTRWQEAVESCQQSLAIFSSLGERYSEGRVLEGLGDIYHSQNLWQEAIAYYQQSLEIFGALESHRDRGHILCELGSVYYSQNLWQDAIEYYQESLEMLDDSEDQYAMGTVLANLGNAYAGQNDWENSIEYYERSLKIFGDLETQHSVASVLGSLGNTYRNQGLWKDTIRCYQRSLEIFDDLEDGKGKGKVLCSLGSVYGAQNLWQEAVEYYQKSLNICCMIGDDRGKVDALYNLGLTYQLQGRWSEAIKNYRDCLKLECILGDSYSEGRILLNLGDIFSARAQYSKAWKYWKAAKDKFHPDSPEAEKLTQKLQHPYSHISKKQLLSGCLFQLTLLAVVIFNLLRSHWLIALLLVITWAGFITYRFWRIRQDRS